MVETRQHKLETRLKTLQEKIQSCNLQCTLQMYNTEPTRLNNIIMHQKRVYNNDKDLFKEGVKKHKP